MIASPTIRGRVLLIHRYFEPDTPPYATILSRIAGALARDGFEVHVLAGQPSYNRAAVAAAPARDVVDGVSIRRWPVLEDRSSSPRKVLNLMWFCLLIVGSVREFRRADVVMAATTPPVLVAFVASRMARMCGARFVYHQQDVWPDVLELQGRRIGPLMRAIRRLDVRTQRRADSIVVLSGDMADTVADRGVDRSRLAVINNFDPWAVEEATGPFLSDGVLDVVFAGNLGAFQGMEDLARVVELTSDNSAIHWHFFGDGVLRSLIDDLVPLGNVTVYGHRPAAEVAEFVARRADLGVVSLHPGVIRAAYPSKTMTYLRNGCPVLALVEEDSELARLVHDRGIGLAVGQVVPEVLSGHLAELARDPGSLQDSRARARNAYRELFGMDRQLSLWSALMARVVALA